MAKIEAATKVLIVPTEAKRLELDRYQVDCHRIEFVQDADGNYFCSKANLENPAFAAIKGELVKMAEIDLKPKAESIESAPVEEVPIDIKP
jgi:hypothetical protein